MRGRRRERKDSTEEIIEPRERESKRISNSILFERKRRVNRGGGGEREESEIPSNPSSTLGDIYMNKTDQASEPVARKQAAASPDSFSARDIPYLEKCLLDSRPRPCVQRVCNPPVRFIINPRWIRFG